MAARLSTRRRPAHGRTLALALTAVSGLALSASPAFATGNISGTVFNDRNANGVHELGTIYGAPPGSNAIENGVGGVTVTATDTSGAVVGTAVTAPNGTYVMSIPVFGAYRIVFSTLPAGFEVGPHGPDSGTAVQFLAEGGGVNASLGLVKPDEFLKFICVPEPLEVGNRLWHDDNADGIQEAGERALPGVTVSITDAAGHNRSTVTDSKGEYYFGVDPWAHYSVQMDLGQPALSGYVPTSFEAGSDRELDSNGQLNGDGSWVWTVVDTGGAGQNDHSLDFGFVDKAAPPAADNPSFEFIKEVKDPATGNWLDADAIAGSPGSNDPTPAVLFSGETAEYRMSVRNTGNVTLTNAHVVDAWCGLDTVIGTIAPGESKSVFCAKVSVVDRINTGHVTGVTPVWGHTALPEQTENASVRVVTPNYTILKEVQDPATGQWLDADASQGSPGSNDGVAALISSGGTAKYRVTVANTGQTELVKAHVTDAWCGLDQTIASIAIGASATLTCEKANITADKVNTATVAQIFAKMPGGRTAATSLAAKSEDAAVKVRGGNAAGVAQPTIQSTPGSPLMTITKRGAKRATVGQIVDYTITLKLAKGRSVARSVKITDMVPEGTAVVRPDALRRSGATIARGSVSWKLGNLAPGATKTVHVFLRMNGNDAMSVTNTAVATADNAPRVTARATTKLVAKQQVVQPKVTG